MITTTAAALIRGALTLINVPDVDEPITPAQATNGFARLNELVDFWGVLRLTMRTQQRVVAAVVNGQATYTIGLTGDFNVARPTEIDTVNLLLTNTTPNTEIPLSELTNEAYEAIAQKTQTNPLPTWWYYEGTIPLSQISVWPVPTDDTNELVIYYPEILAQFPDLITDVLLAAAYARALRTNLAVELAPEYGKPVPGELMKQAGESLAYLKASNAVMADLPLRPWSGGHGIYNILTDTGA